MKYFIKAVLIILPCIILFSGCNKPKDSVKTENNYELTTEQRNENAKELSKEVENLVFPLENAETDILENVIKIAETEIAVPKLMLDVEYQKELKVKTGGGSSPEETYIGITYVDNFIGNVLNYKDYEIIYLQTQINEAIPEITEADTFDKGLNYSLFSFNENKTYLLWTLIPESKKLYVNINIAMDEHSVVGAIVLMKNETEMTQELAKRLYDDFCGIRLADLKNFNESAAD